MMYDVEFWLKSDKGQQKTKTAGERIMDIAKMVQGYSYRLCMIEGSLNSKLPTIWRVEKQMKSR